jgi:ribosomal protein S18 acetylase RimI-like enzyme
MSEDTVSIRSATAADRAGVVAMAPRLAEGVAPWRSQHEAREVGRRWLEGSLDDAAAGTGAVFVAVDAAAATEAARNAAEPAAADRIPSASVDDAASGHAPSVGGRVVGVLSIHAIQHFTGEHDGYIGELVVAERAERRGVGRSLIAAAEAWAQDQGLAHLTLHTGAYNTSARAFYAALGFAEEEVRLTRPLPPSRAGLLPQDRGN